MVIVTAKKPVVEFPVVDFTDEGLIKYLFQQVAADDRQWAPEIVAALLRRNWSNRQFVENKNRENLKLAYFHDFVDVRTGFTARRLYHGPDPCPECTYYSPHTRKHVRKQKTFFKPRNKKQHHCDLCNNTWEV